MSKQPRSLILLLVLCHGLVATSLLSAAEAEPSEDSQTSSLEATKIEWQPYTGTALDGSPIRGEIARIQVPENRHAASSKRIEIAFVRFKTRHPNPRPPIFFLAGGPGGSGIEGAATVGSHPQIRLLEQRDVIGIDQRGTGLSVPDLTQDVIAHELPRDRAISAQELRQATRVAAHKTVSHWRQRGVDLAAYNTEQSAEDLDAIRRALGLEKIALWGTSYGSHLGLAYLRRHSDAVERAMLAKVEGPNHTFKLPSTVQAHLVQLHRMAAEDPSASEATPDVLGTLARLLEQLSEQPVISELKAESELVTLGPLDLQIAFSRALASSQTLAEIPAMLRRFSEGNWSELAEAVADHRQAAIYAMALMMDCASGATAKRWRQLEEEARDPSNLLADAINAPFYPETCAGAGSPDLSDDFRAPIQSEVPVLFVSGTLDVRTPPENVLELLPSLPNAVHVIVENAGHESRELMSPEFRDLLQAYWRGEKVDSVRILLPEPIF